LENKEMAKNNRESNKVLVSRINKANKKKEEIDLKKKYKTRDGHKVELHNIVLENSCGRLVTYPVKGTIILQEKGKGKREKTRYTIWSIYGIEDVVWGNNSEWDLIEIK
jgi:hypothetical protein